MSKSEERLKKLVEPDTLLYARDDEDHYEAVVIPAKLNINIQKIRWFDKDLIEDRTKERWEVTIELGNNKYEATVETSSEVLEFLRGVLG